MTTGNERWLDPQLVTLRHDYIAAWELAWSLAPDAGLDVPEAPEQEIQDYTRALETAIALERRYDQRRAELGIIS